MRLVWDVVTLRERVWLTVPLRERVTETVREPLFVTVSVPTLDGARVAAPLGERDKVTLLLCVRETVGDCERLTVTERV